MGASTQRDRTQPDLKECSLSFIKSESYFMQNSHTNEAPKRKRLSAQNPAPWEEPRDRALALPVHHPVHSLLHNTKLPQALSSATLPGLQELPPGHCLGQKMLTPEAASGRSPPLSLRN
jgi:hypothetical protein